MNELGLALDSYLAVRRALGFKLVREGQMLRRFVEYAHQQRASFVTTAIAQAWANQSNNALYQSINTKYHLVNPVESENPSQRAAQAITNEPSFATATSGLSPGPA